jgi:hypothetical protein
MAVLPRIAWCRLALWLGLLLSVSHLPARLREALAQHPGPGFVLLAPVEDETGSGRVAVLAMTLNPRVRIVAGSLRLVRVGTKEQRPLTGTATHFHTPPYAIGGGSRPVASCRVAMCSRPQCGGGRARWIRRSCL